MAPPRYVPVDELATRLVRFEHSESRYLVERYHFHATVRFHPDNPCAILHCFV
jgi:hypothetical protein